MSKLPGYVARNRIILQIVNSCSWRPSPFGPRTRPYLTPLFRGGRVLTINLLQLSKNMFDENLCLKNLQPVDILVLLDEGNVTKFRQGLTYIRATNAMIDNNLDVLGCILLVAFSVKTCWPAIQIWRLRSRTSSICLPQMALQIETSYTSTPRC